MEQITRMHRSHPMSADLPGLVECISECFSCAQSCSSCADACLSEANVDMLRKCIRLNQDCADICSATGRVLSRESEADWLLVRDLVQACYTACQQCGDECGLHADHHKHCEFCADACQRCAETCRMILANVPVSTPF